MDWSDRLIGRFLAALWAVAVVKALLGVMVYFAVWGGSLGEREFLIDHLSSEILVLGAMGGWWYARLPECSATVRRMVYVSLPMIAAAWQINDRRASLVGVVATVLLLSALRWRELLHRRRLVSAWAVATAAFLMLTWNSEGPVGFAARSIKSFLGEDSSLDYRSIENFNLAAALSTSPVLGFGFGKRFPMVAPLPDISFLFSDFDLIPHNTLLAAWAAGGPFLIAALSWFTLVTLVRGARLGSDGRGQIARIAGLLAVTAVVRWWVFGAFDMGFVEPRVTVMGGVFIGLIWKLSQEMGSGRKFFEV